MCVYMFMSVPWIHTHTHTQVSIRARIHVQLLSCVQFFATLGTVACQDFLEVILRISQEVHRISQEEYLSGCATPFSMESSRPRDPTHWMHRTHPAPN